ncbi:hypothetical protein AN639_01395 [Candidatus Epulonipiscium fishelsonii]|uniref:Uncharacterized protein n=1 Tax=Candidatus Epulonipiscium fishelsonii TaxID=77094 RepID=A0ACC8XBX7_9FIRM|nr:hypothetical protein AN639_01395 [Epulopiscium sp. SCG-B05WGA-EpuloA1]ONI40016.1 hypothetical protein AN396_06610 [Epulopiscium sp. SCG-B11WGA-EpuloA1]
MIDLIFLGFMLIMAILSYKKGFVMTIYELGSTILALVIAFIMYPIFTGILGMMDLEMILGESIFTYISEMEIVQGLQNQADVLQQYLSFIPEALQNTIIMNNNSEAYELFNANNFAEYISSYLTKIIVNGTSILVVWILARILLNRTFKILNFLASMPVIGFFNRLAGAGLGFIKGLIIIWVICLIVPLVITIDGFSHFRVLWEQSIMVNYLYDNNIVLDFLIENVLNRMIS